MRLISRSRRFAGLLASAGAFLADTLPGSAQNFAVDHFVLSGGGGTSTNAQYSLTGTVGQSDAGEPLSAGPYRLEGGFWSVALTLQIPDAPPVRLSKPVSGADAVG